MNLGEWLSEIEKRAAEATKVLFFSKVSRGAVLRGRVKYSEALFHARDDGRCEAIANGNSSGEG